MGPDVFLCTKGMYAKFLVWFFTAMKMKIIYKIFLSILWVNNQVILLKFLKVPS